MCVTDRGKGGCGASLLYPSYLLLHLSYDFHLRLNKLQSRLFKLDLGCLQQVGEVGGEGGRMMEGWAEEIQRKGPRAARRGFLHFFRWVRHRLCCVLSVGVPFCRGL